MAAVALASGRRLAGSHHRPPRPPAAEAEEALRRGAHDKVTGSEECLSTYAIAVCIPCHNEAAAIAQVIADLRQHLPRAIIYVYDNASIDRTSEIARAAGAIVRMEPLIGKGNVVRRMFADVDAEIYVLIDGDATYDVSMAPEMVKLLIASNADMITATRVDAGDGVRPRGHRTGNLALTWIVKQLFGKQITDMLSGYRVLSRRFVKSFPVLSTGFEIETELTIHALELRMGLGELETGYYKRGEGSTSKLSTFRDGARILLTVFAIVTRERPLWVFTAASALISLIAFLLALPVAISYMETGVVARFPTAILSMILLVISLLSLACGLILQLTTIARREMKRLAYLREHGVAASPPVGSTAESRTARSPLD
jgi:glycosyltransferase involved in cell wall biosynthesis